MLLWIIICHLVVTSMKSVRNLLSPLDYCNCLLYGIAKYQRDKLQRIQNTGASCDGPKMFRSCNAYALASS